jgi:hypothetical protein
VTCSFAKDTTEKRRDTMKKQLMMAVAFLVIANCVAFAGNKVVTKRSFLTVADTTVTTNYVTLAYGNGYKSIDKIVVDNNGALGNLTSAITIEDEPAENSSRGVFTTLATVTATAGSSGISYPRRVDLDYTQTYVVTGYSNDTTTVQNIINTNYVPYVAQKLRLVNTLAATNATQAYIDVYVYGEE